MLVPYDSPLNWLIDQSLGIIISVLVACVVAWIVAEKWS